MTEQQDREHEILRDLALEGVRERRRARRWGIFFKFLLSAYLLALLLMTPACEMLTSGDSTSRPHTAVVQIDGVIAPDAPASAARIIDALHPAYRSEGTKGVMLRIDSPGGSPVEAGRVADEITRLRDEHPDIPVYAVAGNLLTSGAYYIAAAADAIYADKASLVGSIGVVMGSFGVTEAMDQLGVERRLYTAGQDKGFLDPFSPVDEEQVAHVERMLDEIHQQFIDVVREGRGDRLEADDETLFSGRFWTGERGVEMGLVDGLRGPGHVARELVGTEIMVDYTPRRNLVDRLSDRVGASVARTLISLGAGHGPLAIAESLR